MQLQFSKTACISKFISNVLFSTHFTHCHICGEIVKNIFFSFEGKMDVLWEVSILYPEKNAVLANSYTHIGNLFCASYRMNFMEDIRHVCCKLKLLSKPFKDFNSNLFWSFRHFVGY